MNYVKLENNIVVQVQPNKQDGFIEVEGNVICGMILNNGVFEVPVIEKTLQELEENYKNLIQAHLDSTAKSWGYDSIYTAIGYIGDPNDIFNKEGLMFRNWRSAVWTYVNEELAKLKQGLRAMPTEEEAIAELPLLDTYRIEQGL